MKRKLIVTLVVLFAALGIVFVFRSSRPNASMPVYQGKTAQQWIDEIFTTNQSASFAALRAMGTNALPAAIENFRKRESAWDRFYSNSYPILPAAIRKRLAPPLPMSRRWSAAELVLLNNRDAEMCAPQLLALLADKNNEAHNFIIGSLINWAGPNHADWVPVMVQCLSETNWATRLEAAAILGRIGTGASDAVPALKVALKDTNDVVRVESAAALWSISGDTNGIAVVKEVLQNSKNSWAVDNAAMHLRQMDPTDLSTLPALMKAIQSGDNGRVITALLNLQLYGAAAQSVVPALVSRYNDATPYLKTYIYDALLKIDPETAQKLKTE